MIQYMIRAVVLVMVWSGLAEAAMMEHFDLAGLVVQSGSIVVAKRTGPGTTSGNSHYSVVRSLRGGLKPGADLEIYDGLYATEGHAVDPEVVLFIAPQGHLISSGMRVVEAGKVFRFEQWSNPGGFTMVPQGKDPIDNWDGTRTAIDRAEFDRELSVAFTRVDALAVARAIADPAKRRAAVLALLPPAGPRADSIGFYVDVLTQVAEAALADAGDLEGALEASRHDHSFDSMGRGFGALDPIMAIATDSAKTIELRTTALRVAAERSDFIDSEPAGRAAIALLADPSSQLRAVAVAATARAGEVMTSDAKEQARLNRLARDGRTAVSALLARETDEQVLYAIAASYREHPLAGRPGHPVAAHARIRRGIVDVDVVCLSRGHKFTDGKVSATGAFTGIAMRSNLTWGCAGEGQGTGTNGPEVLPAGSYVLSADVIIDRKHQVIALGTLTSDGSAMTIAP